MTQPSNPDLEALEGLVTHPGWLLVCGYIDQEWGAVGFAEKLSRTLGNIDLAPDLKVRQLEQATVAQQAALRIREWPKQRIHVLKQASRPQEPNLSRRGPGL